ncbi:MAG: helix-turn-helix domain-containing protein [Christensenellaceae bacterium]
MTYSEKIKTARENLLMTQEEIAVELGVTPITVCRWETGKTEPSIKAKKAFRDLCERNGIDFKENNG